MKGKIYMNNEQNKIISTIRIIADMVRDGRMPLNMIPIMDIKEVMCCALCYGDKNELEKEIVDMFGSMLEQQVAEQNVEACFNIIVLIAKNIQSVYEREADYICREELAVNKIKQSINDFKENEIKKNYLFKEIINSYENEHIDEQFINEHTYESLVTVKEQCNIQMFKDVCKQVFEVALKQIRKKEKTKIVFFLKDSAEWSCEELYQKISKIPNIETEIVVAPFMIGTLKVVNDTYNETIEYFTKRGYKVKGIYNKYQNRYMSWKEMGMPDFVFHLNPHHRAFEECANMCEFPLRIINIYIPYGFMTYGNVDHQYNQMSHQLFWKIFCETDIHRMMAKKYSDIGDYNVCFSGYTKMDTYFIDKNIDENQIWKISEKAKINEVKKIIYAPHWSVRNAFTGFGNFDKHYKEIYEYAKSHEENTSWIIRPHPMLRAGVVQEGVFASEEEFDAYLQMWDELPNAKVSQRDMYIDIFRTSDTMILDSVSFLAEYMYTRKPMLFLTRERQTFNDFGNELIKVLYKADGGDFDKIVEYIDDIVIGNNDYMKEDRELFYQENLNYVEKNGMLASDFICEDVIKQINLK